MLRPGHDRDGVLRLHHVPADRSRLYRRNWALEAGFYNLARGGLDEDLVRLGGISPDRLPPLRASGEPAGAVTRQAAEETGLVAGTPVVTGCADHIASAFVAGACDQGDLVVKFGVPGTSCSHVSVR